MRFVSGEATWKPQVEIQGDEVTKYPELKSFEPIAVKATRIRDMNGQVTTSNWDIVQQGFAALIFDDRQK